MPPYLPSEAYPPALKTTNHVKRGACDQFTGSCVVYGSGGDILTTVTVHAPGQPTTVYGAPQTISQITTQTVRQTATQTVTGAAITRTSLLVQGSSTRKQTYCIATVAGSEIRDLECHTGSKSPAGIRRPVQDDDDDSTLIIALVSVGLALALLAFLLYIYKRRKRSVARRKLPMQPAVHTKPASVASVIEQPPEVVIEKPATVVARDPTEIAAVAPPAGSVVAGDSVSQRAVSNHPATVVPEPVAVSVHPTPSHHSEHIIPPQPVARSVAASNHPRGHNLPVSDRCHHCAGAPVNFYNYACRCDPAHHQPQAQSQPQHNYYNYYNPAHQGQHFMPQHNPAPPPARFHPSNPWYA